MKSLVIVVVILIAIARPFMPSHPISLTGSYEALAHIVVGGLIGAWLVKRERWLLITALAFSAVEVISAVSSMLR
jgi:hypothetical protein